MHTKTIIGGSLAGLITATSVAGALSATTVAEATDLTEEQVIEIALAAVSSELDAADEGGDATGDVIDVEIVLDDGQAFEVEIDAETGAILAIAADDDGDDQDTDDDTDDNYDDECSDDD